MVTKEKEWKNIKVDVKDLIAYEKNNKDHPEEQISLIVQLIDKFGFTNPILIDNKNVIIAGHGRLEAAKRLNYTKVPCRIPKDWEITETEAKALRIADNRATELAVNNMLNIQEEYYSIKEDNIGLEFLTGYQEEDFIGFEEENKEVTEDDFEPPEDIEEIKTDIKRGDIIGLGAYIIQNGKEIQVEVIHDE